MMLPVPYNTTTPIQCHHICLPKWGIKTRCLGPGIFSFQYLHTFNSKHVYKCSYTYFSFSFPFREQTHTCAFVLNPRKVCMHLSGIFDIFFSSLGTQNECRTHIMCVLMFFFVSFLVLPAIPMQRTYFHPQQPQATSQGPK